MLDYLAFDKNKKAFVFELDDVLYPQRDYLLQVYYLFANFLEYTETVPPANDLLEFLKKSYDTHGAEDIFKKAMNTFGIDKKYEENFLRLHVHAKLPLKLLLYPAVSDLLKKLRENQKTILILTKGNPLMQLNKIKQMEWEGFEKDLKVYFYDELKIATDIDPLNYILQENKLEPHEVEIISSY